MTEHDQAVSALAKHIAAGGEPFSTGATITEVTDAYELLLARMKDAYRRLAGVLGATVDFAAAWAEESGPDPDASRNQPVPVAPDLLRDSCLLHGLFDGDHCAICAAVDQCATPPFSNKQPQGDDR